MEPIYRLSLVVTPEVLDGNRHVNNVAYVQWMQEAAIQHSAATGCTRLTQQTGATWVVRTHQIEYLYPAVAGDELTVLTWVADFRKVRSLRRYRFVRSRDEALLAQGETDWVFVDTATGKPRRIPEQIRSLFTILSDDVRISTHEI